MFVYFVVLVFFLHARVGSKLCDANERFDLCRAVVSHHVRVRLLITKHDMMSLKVLTCSDVTHGSRAPQTFFEPAADGLFCDFLFDEKLELFASQ